MLLRIAAVGKVRERYVARACEDFRARLGAYGPLEIVEVKASSGTRPEACLREEGERLLKLAHEDDEVWLLDRQGVQLTSEELSSAIERVVNSGTRRMTFLIAGTYGASDALRERADFVWSLSKLTLLHEWARALVLEQLYRAAKIARNEPYHH